MWNNMKGKINIWLFLCLVLLSCQSEEEGGILSADRRIYLTASIEDAKDSRAPYSWEAPSLEHPLLVDVWASTNMNKFAHTPGADGLNSTNVELHSTARFTNAGEQLLNDAVYPSKENTQSKVYFVGMHPQGWETVNENCDSATYTFTGKEDVMFAPRISGSYGENTGEEDKPWPTFEFKHLLTWLRFEIMAESEAVSNAWGYLESIKIKSPNKVTVNLTKDDFVENEVVKFGDNLAELELYSADNQVFPKDDTQSLPYTEDKVEEAYVLCAPVEARVRDEQSGDLISEYTLLIKTTKRPEKEIQLDLKKAQEEYFTGSTRNTQFTIRLLFKMGNTINISTQAEEWKNGGIVNQEVKE